MKIWVNLQGSFLLFPLNSCTEVISQLDPSVLVYVIVLRRVGTKLVHNRCCWHASFPRLLWDQWCHTSLKKRIRGYAEIGLNHSIFETSLATCEWNNKHSTLSSQAGLAGKHDRTNEHDGKSPFQTQLCEKQARSHTFQNQQAKKVQQENIWLSINIWVFQRTPPPFQLLIHPLTGSFHLQNVLPTVLEHCGDPMRRPRGQWPDSSGKGCFKHVILVVTVTGWGVYPKSAEPLPNNCQFLGIQKQISSMNFRKNTCYEQVSFESVLRGWLIGQDVGFKSCKSLWALNQIVLSSISSLKFK